MTAGALAALFFPFPLPIRGGLAAAYFLGLGAMVGGALFPQERRPWKALFGFLAFSAAAVVVGSAEYYLFRLDLAMTAALIGFVSAAALALLLASEKKPQLFFGAPSAHQDEPRRQGIRPFAMALGTAASVAYAVAVVHGFELLKAASTDLSIRSPWDVAPRMFFVLFFFVAAGAFTAALADLAPKLALIPMAGLAVLISGVAACIYAVGFGFDPFIHQATEKIIFAKGAITPKPLYYVGQYVVVTVIARLLGGHVVAVDTALVPVAISLVIPCAYWSLRRAFGWSPSIAAAASMAVLLLPFGSFAATTPQGFADAVFLITAFLSLPAVVNGGFPRRLLILLAAAVTAIHPLAGILLLIFIAILTYLTTYERTRGAHEAVRWVVLAEIAAIGSIALPAVFVLNSALSGAGVAIDQDALRAPAQILEEFQSAPVVTRQFMAAYDVVYSWKAWRATAIILAGLAGVWLLRRKTRGGLIYLVSAAVFLANFVLLKSFVRFPFLIEYERSNYADRIFELTLFLLAPLAVFAFGSLLVRVAKSYPALKIGVTVLIAALATSSLYLAYPRRDKYESSRGWSTSAADVDAVKLIERDAAGEPYVVLANQSASAAAVRELGFARYFTSKDPARPGEMFFYPIPTGEPLYERFLEMNSTHGASATAEKVMEMTGADTVYYVVSYYWWEAQKIIVSSKRQADRWWNIDDKNFVFKYTRAGE